MSEVEQSKWQPIMVFIRGGGRLECACGALAVVVIGEVGTGYNQFEDVDCFCQSCYLKVQEALTD